MTPYDHINFLEAIDGIEIAKLRKEKEKKNKNRP